LPPHDPRATTLSRALTIRNNCYQTRTRRRRRGTVEGYPEDAGSVPAGFLFNGALSTYERLGFARDRKIGKHRWVVTKVVDPTS